MLWTRPQLEAALDALEARLPRIAADAGDDALEEFAGEAEVIEGYTSHADCAWVGARLTCMLASAGLIPGDTEGEACS